MASTAMTATRVTGLAGSILSRTGVSAQSIHVTSLLVTALALAIPASAEQALTEALAALVVGTREATVARVATDAHNVFFLNQGFSSGSGAGGVRVREVPREYLRDEYPREESRREDGLDRERSREGSRELGGEGGR
ncbi:hypothetical protein E6O75_ATG02997 [Venturia nashicola]|uniref:Uncharacterized protein n=1 Tax=Venturia nashicola TaxID=86259 RepID=A0A4Z1PDY7_9PEZI|nr:hypothetical protein E6O75_ATG02997 [Venturia nashicola]